MDARCDDTPEARGAARGDPRGDCLQGLRVRRAWRRDEPALRLGCGRRRRAAGTGLRAGPRTALPADDMARAPGCRMPGCTAATAEGSRRSTSAGKGRFTLLTGIGGEGWVEAAAARRQGTRHRHRGHRHRPAPGLGGSIPATGPTRARWATAASCSSGPTSMSPGGARRLPAIRPANCAASSRPFSAGERHGRRKSKAFSPRRTRSRSSRRGNRNAKDERARRR